MFLLLFRDEREKKPERIRLSEDHFTRHYVVMSAGKKR